MDKIRIFEAFAGYGSQSMAMQRLKEKFGLDYEIVGISEIDKYAIQAYNAVHPGVKNYGDISKIDWNEVPDFDLYTYSFPCQDISSAGQLKGLEKGSGTRSSLLWECQKAIEIKRPKYCLMENVSALVSEKFRPYFLEWERLMCRYGYTNYNKVLNAKDYGIPQNRERIFMVSIHNADRSYYWPEPFKLEERLKDVLEQNVDEKYYLSQQIIDTFNKHKQRNLANGNGFGWNPLDKQTEYSMTLKASTGERADDNYIKEDDTETIRIPQATEQGYVEVPQGAVFDGSYPNSKTRRGRLQDGGQTSPTLMASGESPCYYEGVKEQNYRIRKLTERECFRLMGVSESDIDKIQASGVSRSQQYKMAGNSIVVDVLEHIFRKLFIETGQESQQLSLF